MSRVRIIETSVEGEGYFAWHQHRVALAGEEYWVSTRASLGPTRRIDPAAGLLAAHLALDPTDRILDLRCRSGLPGAAAVRRVPARQVQLTDTHSVAVEAARRTLARNGFDGVHVEAGGPPEGKQAVDAVILRIPRSKAQVHRLLWQAYRLLRPGGRLYLAGGNKEGIKTYLGRLDALYAEQGVIAYRKGHRLGLARKAAGSDLERKQPPTGWLDPRLDEHGGYTFPVQVRETELQVHTQPGLFSWDRLDAGSELLLETVEIEPAARVLDLGCGNGALGAVCSRLAHRGSVVLSDVDVGAVQSARQTLALNQIHNAEVVVSDCGERLADSQFDAVLTNPPFHRGRSVRFETAFQFIRDAHRLLHKNGRLYLVANRFLQYERELLAHFEAVDRVAEDTHYQVFRAVK